MKTEVNMESLEGMSFVELKRGYTLYIKHFQSSNTLDNDTTKMRYYILSLTLLISSCIGGAKLEKNIEGSWTPDMTYYQKEIDNANWVLYPYTLQPIQPNDSLIFQPDSTYNFKMGRPDSSNVTSPSYDWIIENVKNKKFTPKKWSTYKLGFLLEDPITGEITKYYVVKCKKGKMVIRYKNRQRLYLKKSK